MNNIYNDLEMSTNVKIAGFNAEHSQARFWVDVKKILNN